MLIGSRYRPRPTGSQSHRLALTPVRDSGRCGWGSSGRLAGSGGRWTAETGSRAIPRGRGRRPCWGVRAALVRAGWTVGQVCRSRSHQLPLVTSLYCVGPPLQPTRAFCGPLACRSHWVSQRDRLSQRNCRPLELPAGRGRSAVLRPDVTLELQGVGAAALRLTCSGGGVPFGLSARAPS